MRHLSVSPKLSPSLRLTTRVSPTERAMKLNDVLAAMRAGAWLHLTLADGPRWQLNDGATATTVNSRTVAGMIKRGHITGNNDSLFDIVPSQTWRYTGPKEPPQVGNGGTP